MAELGADVFLLPLPPFFCIDPDLLLAALFALGGALAFDADVTVEAAVAAHVGALLFVLPPPPKNESRDVCCLLILFKNFPAEMLLFPRHRNYTIKAMGE